MNHPKRIPFPEENTTNIQKPVQRNFEGQQASFHSTIPIPIEYTRFVEHPASAVSTLQTPTIPVPKSFPNRNYTDSNLQFADHNSVQHPSMFSNTTRVYGVNFQFSKDFYSFLPPFLDFVRSQPTNRLENLSSQIANTQVLLPQNANYEDLDEDTRRRIADSNGLFVELARDVADLFEGYTTTIDSPLDSPDLPATHLMNITNNFASNNNSMSNNNNSNLDNNKKAQYKFKQPINKPHAFDRQWRRHFDELAEFKTKYGHCNVSRTTKGYENLGNWLADQRRKLRRGKMTKEQYDMLTQLGKC